MENNYKTFLLALLFILLAELFSFFVFLLPEFNAAAFIIITALTLALSIVRLEFGAYIALAELFIGSKGYLFALEINDFTVSVRIGIFAAVMSVWLGRIIHDLLKRKINPIKIKNYGLLPYFIILFLFIAWGLLKGYLGGNIYSHIYFDFNGWLFFAYLLPIYYIFSKNRKKQLRDIRQILLAAAAWLSVKTIVLLYIFSHNMESIARVLYHWVRDTGVGEITLIQGGFYRIFFQSHIYVLAAFFVLLAMLAIRARREDCLKKNFIISLFALSGFLAVNILNFSRSNWVGIIFALFLFLIYIFIRYSWKRAFAGILILAAALLLAAVIITGTVKFPFPDPLGGFDASDLLKARAGKITGEDAISSRWSLYPELWSKIKEAPVLGQGFGSTVTYVSSDPRVLEDSPEGIYTTYAFEWGWLDIWLKIGFFGLIIYIALIFKIIVLGISRKSDTENKYLIFGLSFGLVALAVISFFSPYLNHPLGIGYIVLLGGILDHRGE